MTKVLMIGIGGFVGAIARYAMSIWIANMAVGNAFPFATWTVNIVGCALLGFGGALVERHMNLNENVEAMVFVGLLGAFTTFSTFAGETIQLLKLGNLSLSLLYVALSVIVGLAALLGGMWLARLT
jgi:CrcB protein